LPPESTFSPKVAKPLPAATPPKLDRSLPYLAMTESKTTEEAAATENTSPPGAVPPPATEGISPPAVPPVEGKENGAPPSKEGSKEAAPSTDAAAEEPPKKKKKKKKGAEPAPEQEQETKAADADVLLAKGNPLRRVRGGLTAGIASFLAYLLMAHNGQLRVGVPLGILFLAIASFGVMDFLGTFDDEAEHVATQTTLGELTVPLARLVATLVLYAMTIAGGLSGVASQWMWGGLVTFAFLLLVFSVFDLGVVLGPWRLDELGLARPIWQREGFWVIAAGALLMLPTLGAYSLWDPWETHYGEVAREVLARDDWISLWWAQDGWFWSKPILDFWIQAIFMATLGVHYKPDQMMEGASLASAHPEWVVRTPVFLLTILAMYLIYKGVSKFFGRRAGLLGGLILATMPDWYFLGHQTMTDMPCIAPMTSAMGLLICGLFVDPEKRVKVYEVKTGKITWRLSGWHLVFGAILIVALPQIIYLFSRNLELVVHGSGAHGFRAHWDEFRSGSGGGNCGLPGNEACTSTASASIPPSLRNGVEGVLPTIWRLFGAFEPLVQAILWSAVLGTVLYLNWGERRARRLYYLGAWFFAAIATMGKGPEGFALPMLCTFMYLCVARRWGELLRLEILSGLLIILCVALPWYVASYVRHGSPFTDRLIFHDMFNRAFHHVHDTNEGDDTSFRFYIWQLGYALFPWTGLAALGLTYWLRRPDASDKGKNDVPVLLTMWFLFGFALFSFMGTKFHHYIFPCVPPIAMLLGIVFDDLLGPGPLISSGRAPADLPPGSLAIKGLLPTLAVVFSGVALFVFGVSRFLPGSLLGTKNGNDLTPPSYSLAIGLTVVGIVVLVAGLHRFRGAPLDEAPPPPKSEPPDAKADAADGAPYRDEDPVKRTARVEARGTKERRVRHEQLMIAAAAASAALILGIVARDLIIKPDNADQPGAIRLLQLFTYNYRRAWPDSLDFSAILTGFSVVAVTLGLALSVRSVRRPVTVGLLALGAVWAVWGLDVYMPKMSPHWGQHEVIQAYYENRKGPEEPIVAYQMNWKGENFYTGNKIPAFVSSGGTFTTWLKQQREKGVKVMFFITEHGRIGGLKGEVGAKSYKEVTDKVLNNKFVIVRAEL
jgi:4-amino-4-deoxy-L-arabinose transferase-like glycosyltransferase